MKKIFGFLAIAILGGGIALTGYKLLLETPQIVQNKSTESQLQMVNANYTPTNIVDATPTNFTDAAEKTINAVVHVKNTAVKTQENPWAELFYGRGQGERKYTQVGTGSGVIITSDGFIITNNHVIDGANDIEITLNNRKKYKADLIGTDVKNDIALLKISTEDELPYIPYGNSDNLKIGEWVLAVGNPYNLTSTVTAGIVSAKGRDLDGNNKVESFIQTDAAVNPGNSGGALVNTRGELVGINTAISSKTGSFIGYSFAVPSNIAKKVVEDIMEFGTVQEAIIGFSRILNDEVEGVIIGSIDEKSGAKKAGLKVNDIIVGVNNVKISKFSDLKGQLTAKRPSDKISVTVLRNGKKLSKMVTLSKRYLIAIPKLNIVVKDASKSDKRKFNISGGAKIVSVSNRNLEYYGIKNGYIITKVNKVEVRSANSVKDLIDKYYGKGPIYIEVINNNGEIERYGFR